jgi:hypothetical protein
MTESTFCKLLKMNKFCYTFAIAVLALACGGPVEPAGPLDSGFVTEYLGIEPVEPGFKTVRIDPHLGDLEWAEGTFPTPYGLIQVRHQKKADGSVSSDVKLPKGVRQVK